MVHDLEVVECVLPVWALHALENNDWEPLSPDEKTTLRGFIIANKVRYVGEVGEEYAGTNDLTNEGGQVVPVKLLCKKGEKPATKSDYKSAYNKAVVIAFHNSDDTETF